MSITVKDVARAAGVSRTTVSNVFNDRLKFSEDTRRAVLEAAQQLGYKPNLAARSLVANQSQLIGLILPPYVEPNTLTNSPFYNTIMDGIYSVLQNETYYDLILTHVPNPAEIAFGAAPSQVSDRLDRRGVDGVLALGEFEDSFLQELNARSIPVVMIDNYSQHSFSNFSYINSDDETGGYLATRRLIERGFSRIALGIVLTTSLKNSPVMQKRFEGYRRALAEAEHQPDGLPIQREECVFECSGAPFEAGKRLVEKLLEQHIDAIFCTEDMLAVGVLHCLLEKGIRVGQEFGLVGFDNFNITRQVHPELTTIDQNIYEKGEIAARTLLSILKEKSRRRNAESSSTNRQFHLAGTCLILPVSLVIRETC